MQTLEFDDLSEIVYHLKISFRLIWLLWLFFFDFWDSNDIFHDFSGKTNNDSRLQYFKDRIKSKEISLQFEEPCINEYLKILRDGGTGMAGFGTSVNPILTGGGADYAHRKTIRPPDFLRPSTIPDTHYLVLLRIGSKNNFDPSKLLWSCWYFGPNAPKFVCWSPKVLEFQWKNASLGVRSPYYLHSKAMPK